jgi:DNA-binding response OmpR family regulator
MTDSCRLLVVEDNLDLAGVVRSLLEFEGHRVEVVHSGTEGLSLILSRPYDLVILDWDLPGVSGLDILAAFRKIGARTPVIMLTGKDSIEEKELGLDGGADDYLTKPFNMKELGARVRAHLRRSGAGGAASSGQVSLGDISLDGANLRASRAGRNHALPEAEYRLLEFAAKYPHIRPSFADLAAVVWSDQQEDNLQKLQAAIRRLRKKFDPAGQLIFPHLSTVMASEGSGGNVSSTVSKAVSSAISSGGTGSSDQSDFDEDLLSGLILNGKYELGAPIGGGGCGVVYRGRHVDLDTEVAIKVLHINVLANSDTVRRFQREAKIAGLLAHPNIVAVRDFGFSEQNLPYLVMELVDGASLSEVLQQGGRPALGETIDIFVQACAGLACAHEKGLVHRDIKPSNLMLTNGGQGRVLTKIVDFGLARAVEADLGQTKITQTGHVLGSPPYMSPEQCRGEALDARADIYSVGCALFEALHGRPPFCGGAPLDILVNQVTSPPPVLVLSDQAPLVQKHINDILQRCLQKDPQLRYQSAAQLGTVLSEFAELARSVNQNKEGGWQ